MQAVRRLRAPAVFVVLAASLAGVWTTSVGGIRRADEPSVRAHDSELLAETRLTASQIARWIADARSSLSSTATALGPWTGGGAQLPRARTVLDQGTGLFDGGMLVVDNRGQVVATATQLAALDRQLRPSPAVAAALEGRNGASDLIEDPLLRVVQVALTAPLEDGRGSVTGALVGYSRVPDGTLRARLVAAQSALGHAVFVVTTGSTVLDGTGDAPPSIRHADADVRLPATRASHGGDAGLVRYHGEAGVALQATYATLPDGWSLVMPRPVSTLSVTGRRATSAAGVALAVVLAGSFAAIMALLVLVRSRTARVEETKRAFLAIAGHELRTPLTVMKGFTDLLVTRWDKVPDESRRSILETISFQVRNLEHLVERLLLGAQLEAGVSPSISHEVVELRPLLAATAAHHGAISPSHTFVVDAPAGLDACADRKALDHVLTNLVENAVKYSPNGGVVTLRATSTARDRVLVEVEDEGIGLPTDLDSIFEKFVQREAVDTRVHDEGGVGLGLYIVRTLVDDMGGSVRAERRTPQGARMVVSLPRTVTARRRLRRRRAGPPSP
ncbi:MAG TPA: HAMP domain-containing sensor histidine kinase [Acidimicrobiales bacterium]|nr:HAMP domain-containing sensor histidine kinase [Acidimicrobiales bacterium]